MSASSPCSPVLRAQGRELLFFDDIANRSLGMRRRKGVVIRKPMMNADENSVQNQPASDDVVLKGGAGPVGSGATRREFIAQVGGCAAGTLAWQLWPQEQLLAQELPVPAFAGP